MSEMRTNPRTGWVRADQARGKEDIEREQALVDEIASKEKAIKMERELRDRSVPLEGIKREDLAQGTDPYNLTATFQDKNKRLTAIDVALTWGQIFSVIGPSMYGYILRRGAPTYNKSVGAYNFEAPFIEYVRTKIVEQAGTRQITLLAHQIDEILIQFRQLGLVAMVEKTKDDDGEDFRGYSLTKAGEEYLTRLKVKTRGADADSFESLLG